MAPRRFALLAALLATCSGFAPPLASRVGGAAVFGGGGGDDDDMAFLKEKMNEAKPQLSLPNPFELMSRFAKGVDDFVDDAMMRKLGNGEKFYGKRKSNFYGADDPGKRKSEFDTSEEYSGPTGGSYFSLDSEGRPVTRKGSPIGWSRDDDDA